jgi:hypothetical protein
VSLLLKFLRWDTFVVKIAPSLRFHDIVMILSAAVLCVRYCCIVAKTENTIKWLPYRCSAGSQRTWHLCYEHSGVQSDETVASNAALHVAKRHLLVRTTEEATCIYLDGNWLPLASYRQILRGTAWRALRRYFDQQEISFIIDVTCYAVKRHGLYYLYIAGRSHMGNIMPVRKHFFWRP